MPIPYDIIEKFLLLKPNPKQFPNAKRDAQHKKAGKSTKEKNRCSMEEFITLFSIHNKKKDAELRKNYQKLTCRQSVVTPSTQGNF